LGEMTQALYAHMNNKTIKKHTHTRTAQRRHMSVRNICPNTSVIKILISCTIARTWIHPKYPSDLLPARPHLLLSSTSQNSVIS
jgi:hypothetical protein